MAWVVRRRVGWGEWRLRMMMVPSQPLAGNCDHVDVRVRVTLSSECPHATDSSLSTLGVGSRHRPLLSLSLVSPGSRSQHITLRLNTAGNTDTTCSKYSEYIFRGTFLFKWVLIHLGQFW